MDVKQDINPKNSVNIPINFFVLESFFRFYRIIKLFMPIAVVSTVIIAVVIYALLADAQSWHDCLQGDYSFYSPYFTLNS
jgi:hypothetical protein